MDEMSNEREVGIEGAAGGIICAHKQQYSSMII